VESLLGEAEVSALETSVQKFPDAVFHVIDVESLLREAEVSALETRVLVQKGHNF